MNRRQFLTASGLIIGFPAIIKAQIAPGFLGAAGAALRGGGGVSDTEVVTGVTPGTLRNDYDGTVGFYFLCNTNITVTSVGRWIPSGHPCTQIDVVAIYDSGFGFLTSAEIPTLGTGNGLFVYADLDSPLALSSGSNYYLEGTVINGDGDQWYDSDCSITHTAVIGSVVAAAGAGTGAANKSYLPPSFKYHL